MTIMAPSGTGPIAIKVAHWLQRFEAIGPASGPLVGILFPVALGLVGC
jgi:hypothetical protein